MKGNRLIIKQVGYTYVFQVEQVITKEMFQEIRNDIRQQLKEGYVLLPANVKLVSVEPRLETFIE